MTRRARRVEIVPGSLADRLRTACPAGAGATMRELIAPGLARPEDVKAEVLRLRAAGYIRIWGDKRGRRYFWRRTNRRRTRGQLPTPIAETVDPANRTPSGF